MAPHLCPAPAAPSTPRPGCAALCPPPAADAGARGAHKSGELTCPPRRDGGDGAAPRVTAEKYLVSGFTRGRATGLSGAQQNPWEGEGIGLQPPSPGVWGDDSQQLQSQRGFSPRQGAQNLFWRLEAAPQAGKLLYLLHQVAMLCLILENSPLGALERVSKCCHHYKFADSISWLARKHWPLSMHNSSCSSQAGDHGSPVASHCWSSNPDTCPVPCQHEQPYFFPCYKYNCHAAPQCRRSGSNSLSVGPAQHQAYSAFLCFWGLFSAPSASSKATKKTSPLWKPTPVKLTLLGTQPKHCSYVPLLLLQICVFPLNPTQKMLCGYHWGRLWPAGSAVLHS